MLENGFWIDNKNNIINISFKKHIDFVFSNPELFNLTQQEIKEIHDKYNEKIGTEGKQRDEILTNILKLGWVRIRFYYKTDQWSVQCDSFQLRKKIINRFVEIAVYGKSVIKVYNSFTKNFDVQETKKGLISVNSKISITTLKEGTVYQNVFINDFIKNEILVESKNENLIQYIYSPELYNIIINIDKNTELLKTLDI